MIIYLRKHLVSDADKRIIWLLRKKISEKFAKKSIQNVG